MGKSLKVKFIKVKLFLNFFGETILKPGFWRKSVFQWS